MASGPPQTRYAQSSGANIAYQVSGAGPPDLVMLPGLVSHLDLQWQQTDYRRFVRALERGGRLIRLDKRGTGLSDPVGELPTAQERVQDVAAVMAAVKSSRAVLFGVSDGGRAAIAFAAAHPGRTQGLVLYGTSYQGPGAALLRRYRSVVRHWGEGRLAELVAPSLAGPKTRQAAGAFERAAASPAMAAALVESLGVIDVRDLMSGLTVPVLVLHRDGDLIPVADARLVAGQIPGAVLKILPGRDHLPWVADWAAVIEDTWDALGLCGTGSHHLTLTGVRVPREQVAAPFFGPARHDGPLWRLPLVTLAAPFLAAVPLGVARRALDEFAALAVSKIRGPAAHSVAHDAVTQHQLARAEGALGAARSFLFATIADVWDTACRGDEPSLPQRAQVLLAANQAVRAGTEAVDRVFRLAGAEAVFAGHPLQRCFRDIHTAGQHILFSSSRDQAFAKVRLGIDQPTFLI